METETRELRKGWTTGTCATAATKAALTALLSGDFPDPVEITLPGGTQPAFSLAQWSKGENWTSASIVKNAGDDPDVTHGAMISVKIQKGTQGSGITFKAGSGVGIITRAGLPLPPQEPAINPVPRAMMSRIIKELSPDDTDFEIEISVEDGERLAQKTLNPRLGIVGGISILGTTGIVIPYSCSAWIHSIHRGIDVARSAGIGHIAGSTGSTSEKAVQEFHNLTDSALIDMGDFVGGMLKYLRRHPVPKVSIAGGMAKMTKLAQGKLDLHSKRGLANLEDLAKLVQKAGASHILVQKITQANTVAEAFQIATEAGVDIGQCVAEAAWNTAAQVLSHPEINLEILVFDRKGQLLAEAPFKRSDHHARPLKRL